MSRRAIGLVGLGVIGIAFAMFLRLEPRLSVSVYIIGLTLVFLGLAVLGAGYWARLAEKRRINSLIALVHEDPAPCFATDHDGRVLYSNHAAKQRFDLKDANLLDVVQSQFASPAAVMFRLQSRAQNMGSAREDLVIRRGHLRLSVTMIAHSRFLWRLDEFLDAGTSGRGAENMSLPFVVSNRAGVVLFCNDSMRKHLGTRPKRLEQIFQTTSFASGQEVEVQGENGPLRAIVAEVEGVGDRREIFLLPVPKRLIRDALQSDFEHVPVALVRFSPEGKVKAANKLAREMLQNCPLEGATIRHLFDDIGRPVESWLSDVVEERLPTSIEVLRLRVRDEESFAQVQLRRVVDEAGLGAVAVLSDATALKKIEAQFTQSQKMQAIGQLAGGVAHDFNNLLTAISGHCDLLLLRHGADDIDHADLEQIRQNSNRAAALVAQLLAFSRKQTLKPQRLDLQDVLADTSHLLNRLVGEKIRIQVLHDPFLEPVRADRRQLEQVIMNLVVNARDAMPEGGLITLATEALHLDEPEVRGRVTIPSGSYCILRVIDQGVGIPADRLDKIFEPFFTTKRLGEGTGLGLSTVYGIVKQSGGYVFVDSTVGSGTCFEMLMPVYDASKYSEPEPALPVIAAQKAVLTRCEGVVLLVEDEAPVRAFASRALRMRGLTVIEADSAEAALKVLEDPDLVIDIFVTDVIMPGLDGPSWVKIALETRPDVKVIFVSGYAEDYLSNQHVQLPNAVFLPKPFSLSDLTLTVQAQLS